MTVQAAGIALKAPDGRILFLRRSGTGDHAGEWCFPGGGVEPTDQNSRQAARRELFEETGLQSLGSLHLLDRSTSSEGVDFSTFVEATDEARDPKLNDEHDAFVWADAKNLPKPLHPGVEAVLSNEKMQTQVAILAQDRAGRVPGVTLLGGYEKVALALDEKVIKLAFDRAPEDSVRDKSKDGHLHISKAHISKADVNPYVGREIPRWKQLGLDPDKVYMLLRDPEEMAKAVDTFNRLPILKKHVPVTSKKHPHELVVGATGSDAAFDGGYLDNSLAVWEEGAIGDVEADRKRQLSSAYHYDAEMTPGEFNGTRFDGRMRNIVGNHVALVSEGRAGDDVIVGDSKGNLKMATKKIVLSRLAAVAVGALAAHLAPKLAQDAKFGIAELTPLFKGITPKNFKTKSAGIIAELTKATEDLLAQDASIEDLGALLDTLGSAEVAEAKDADPAAATATTAPVVETDDTAIDADPVAKIMEFCKGKLSPEDMAALETLTSAGIAGDEEDDDAAKAAKEKAAKEKIAKDEKDKENMITKPAMDAALKKTREDVKAEMRAENAALNEALKIAKPYVGDIAIAMDSAQAVYEHTLKAIKPDLDLTDVHPSAYKAILTAIPVPGAEKGRSKSPRIAMDAKAVKGFAERFPGTENISIG